MSHQCTFRVRVTQSVMLSAGSANPEAWTGSELPTLLVGCAAERSSTMRLTVSVSIADVRKLMAEKQMFQKKFYAPNSVTTRSVQIRRYLDFIEEFAGEFPPTPCPTAQVGLYAVWLARTMKYSSVTNYLSGLNFFLKQEGATPIDYTQFDLATTLKGIKREKGVPPRQATPLLPDMLRRIFSLLSPTLGHTAWRAAVLCSFRGLLRKCQITLSDSTLRRRDFRFLHWCMIISIRRSKTTQFRERVLEVPVARCPDSDLCAVFWTEKHFRQLPAPPGALAFRLPTPEGASSPMRYNTYQGTLKHFSAEAGLDPDTISSHSLRRGGCTYLSLCGATLEELRTRGDWSSDTVFLYLKSPLSVRIMNDMRVASALAVAPPPSAGGL